MPNLDAGYIVGMRTTLSEFHVRIADLNQAYDGKPTASSPFAGEQAASPDPESLVTTLSIGIQLIELGGEHITAFVKTITEPMEPIACGTCVRSMLESCALAAWLLDPSIDAKERVCRTFAIRFEGLEQQLKFARAANQSTRELKAAEDHIDKVESDAIKLGYPRIIDARRRRLGIGRRMPGATEVIKLMLDAEIAYRLLSAVAHGHFWAITALGFTPIIGGGSSSEIGGVPVSHFEKSVKPEGIARLGISAANAIGRAVWNQCRYFGWDEARFDGILTDTFNALQVAPSAHFWK